MAYGVTHTETIPTVGVTVGPDYATQVNACLAEIRATLDARVTPSGMSMSDDLSFLVGGSYSAVTDLDRAHFENKSTELDAGSFPTCVFVANGELYYNDDAGQRVQITLDGTLNLSATGGITGSGYGSSGVEVNWAAVDGAYKLKSGASSYAHAWLNSTYFWDGDTNFVRVAAPAVATDYTMTLPAAVPASTLPVVMSSAGALSTTGTLANLVAITTSGNATVGGDLAVTGTSTMTGLITANGGLTGGSGDHVTVVGTGQFKHGARHMYLSCYEAARFSDGAWDFPAGGDAVAQMDSVDAPLWIPINLDINKVITDVVVFVRGDAVNRLTMTLYSAALPGGAPASLGTADSTASAVDQSHTLLSGGSLDIAADTVYYVQVTLRSGSAVDSDLGVYGVRVSYTEP